MMMDFNKNGFIEIKIMSKKDLNLKERKKIKNENNKINDKIKNKSKNKIKRNNNVFINYITPTFIKYVIIIGMFNQKVKNNIFDSFYFKFSKITLTINNTGYNYIFGHGASIYYPDVVYINENKQDKIDNNYLNLRAYIKIKIVIYGENDFSRVT